MERAGQSLWGALRRVARPEKPLDLLTAVWPLMVGRRLAAHTRPTAWNKGRVDVAVDDPSWRSELERMSKDVRTQINRWWGSELVTEVRFVAERRGKPAAASDQSKRPEVRNSKAPQAAGRVPAEDKLGAALKELEPALGGIADADLRDLISRVASKYLDRPKRRQDSGTAYVVKQGKK